MGWWTGIDNTKVGDGPADFIGETLKKLNKSITLEQFLKAFEKGLNEFSDVIEANFPLKNFRAVTEEGIEVKPDSHDIDSKVSQDIKSCIDYIIMDIKESFNERATLRDIFANFKFVIYNPQQYFKTSYTSYIIFKSDNN